MSFYMPYGTGKKPTKHTDATVRVFLAKLKCANVLAGFRWRSENVPLFAAARPILLSFFELPRMMTFKSTGSGATPARACSVLVLRFVPVERACRLIGKPGVSTLNPK